MLYQITDGTVSQGGQTILSHIDFEIKGNEKIAIVGKNGAGKTTLLKLIAGELNLDRDDKRTSPGLYTSRRLTIGMLSQQTDRIDRERTVEDLLLSSCPARDTFSRERYDYEHEYDSLFTGFGFSKADKNRQLGEFSGGQQTRIRLIRLLLQKPDILLLDEPTNHLDLEATQWLEQYIRRYERAVILVSHDRFFLDQTAEIIYELSGCRLYRYPGNYTNYRQEKQKRLRLQQKAYEQQQEEVRRLEELIERFRHKPNKAAFARSRKKILERMTPIEKPETDDVHLFTAPILPLEPGSKWVLDAKHLKIGYDRPLLELDLRLRKGQKLGILGPNGAGKTTFLKTAAGLLPPLSGTCRPGERVTIGYFDQHSAEILSDKTVAEHFHDRFPALTEKEVRSILGAFLFGGKAASTKVSSLSGGEKARLVLAELLQSRPNFLILDEPTNHMDIQAKETLESAFQAYQGTILFVSHDRYFLRQVADCILIFEHECVMYYPFGYEHYLERMTKEENGIPVPARIKAEDQALIAGIQAVPKAERHLLREIPEQEAYADWQMAATQELAEKQYEELLGVKEKKAVRQLEEMAFCGKEPLAANRQAAETEQAADDYRPDRNQVMAGDPLPCDADDEFLTAQKQYNSAWTAWHEACLEWYDIWNQFG